MSSVAVTLIVGLVTLVWARTNFVRPANNMLGCEGTITPGKISAAIVTLFGSAIAIAGITTMIYGMLGFGLICLTVGAGLAFFMSPSLTHIHDLSWDKSEVRGPSRLFGPTLGLSQTKIRWDEIVATGKTVTSYWFIQSIDGRRIYWSYLYPGYGSFVTRLIEMRPQLQLPEDIL